MSDARLQRQWAQQDCRKYLAELCKMEHPTRRYGQGGIVNVVLIAHQRDHDAVGVMKGELMRILHECGKSFIRAALVDLDVNEPGPAIAKPTASAYHLIPLELILKWAYHQASGE